ncbi:MAG: Dockerin type domain, partial [Planctomycetota bacterium]
IGAYGATGFGTGNITVTASGSCGTPCPADLNGDGVVSSFDVAALLNGWGTPTPDLNGDGIVGSADVAVLLNAWGNCP